MKQIYVSDDGIKNGTEEEVSKYEKELKDKKERERKLKEEKISRKNEIDKKSKELNELIDSYYHDYHEIEIKTVAHNPNIFDFDNILTRLL